MKRLFALVAACFVASMPGGARAGDPQFGVKSLPGWEAVGRLNISGRSMCTGSLIAPNLVLTAAHCLFDPATGRAVDPKTIKFEAGLMGRRSKAARSVAKAVLHPGYEFRRPGKSQIGSDIAVLRLSKPISSNEIQPLAMSWKADRGDSVGVLSYNYTHATRPNLERSCQVLAKQKSTLVMSCRVDFGASGAPVLEVIPGRVPKLISVISAKAAMGNKRVSIGTALDSSLWRLMQMAG
ncbi:V8-like Glu-specific endopeptidase [Phaeobacter sp. CECT 5382]|uniref:trypsin-like serine peptidase n=1 Tax=Rhodobacterales TaxID=204455 RepID=UPI0006D9EB5D|nr:trypsin-like serine protease [Phaeobacter sp. CECT 5382]CUH89101.1 V8-like Glu-specific endopeptidase [Phaeobacter sp. CECT 5382]